MFYQHSICTSGVRIALLDRLPGGPFYLTRMYMIHAAAYASTTIAPQKAAVVIISFLVIE